MGKGKPVDSRQLLYHFRIGRTTVPALTLSLDEPLTRNSACDLLRISDEELPVLLTAARAAKERFKPGIITYSKKVFLPLTNLCRDYCGYCIFRRDPGQPGAHTMTPEEGLSVAKEGERLGCTEALFSLGDKPELAFPEMRETLKHLGYNSTLHHLEAMCELVLRETSLLPHPNPGLLSAIGETLEDRVDTLLAIRDLHRRYGHIQEVIVQNFRVKPGIPMSHWPEPTEAEMLRTVAVARLLMPDMNIQAPPNLSDPYYDDLLDAGINDWGGISPLTPDFINPEKPWPHLDTLQQRTEAKGFTLRQRLPVYPEFLPRIVSSSGLLAEKVRASAGNEGLARAA